MSENLYNVEQIYKDCIKCDLSERRKALGQTVEFGTGYTDALAILVTPRPLTYSNEDTPEADVLKQIWNKVQLDPRDWYYTATIMCPNQGTIIIDQIKACNERLKRTLYSISPKVVVLMGGPSYFAFFGYYKEEKFGPIPSENYNVFYTYDIKDYLELKATNNQEATVMALEIFDHWQQITDKIRSISYG